MPFTDQAGKGGCLAYGTGNCCQDKHFDPAEVLPAKAGQAVCGAEDSRRATTDKASVNCTDCLELIHS